MLMGAVFALRAEQVNPGKEGSPLGPHTAVLTATPTASAVWDHTPSSGAEPVPGLPGLSPAQQEAPRGSREGPPKARSSWPRAECGRGFREAEARAPSGLSDGPGINHSPAPRFLNQKLAAPAIDLALGELE